MKEEKLAPALTYVANKLNEQQMIISIVNGAKNIPACEGSLSNDELNRLVAFPKNEQ
jgi:hypothetical protein